MRLVTVHTPGNITFLAVFIIIYTLLTLSEVAFFQCVISVVVLPKTLSHLIFVNVFPISYCCLVRKSPPTPSLSHLTNMSI